MGNRSYTDAKGWLRPEEREALVRLARDTAYGTTTTIVNIGVEYGASLICLRHGAPNARIFGIDIDMSKVVGNHGAELIEDDSGEVVKGWTDDIDLVFIDGDHTYKGVVRDLAWLNHVRPGGYAIFHDCYDFDEPGIVHRLVPGVNKAVEEWAEKNKYNIDNHLFFDYWIERKPIGTMRIFRKLSNV